jgi:hypothetical protein
MHGETRARVNEISQAGSRIKFSGVKIDLAPYRKSRRYFFRRKDKIWNFLKVASHQPNVAFKKWVYFGFRRFSKLFEPTKKDSWVFNGTKKIIVTDCHPPIFFSPITFWLDIVPLCYGHHKPQSRIEIESQHITTQRQRLLLLLLLLQ